MFEQYPDLMTVQQVQEALSVGRNKAYDLLKSNEIVSLKIGRSIRVPKVGVLEYIDKVCYTDKVFDECAATPLEVVV